MTIHSGHPFAEDPDPVRRFRGRIGGTVSLWTSGTETSRAGLTVTSYLLGAGERTRILALLDPDAALTETLLATGSGVVQLLAWEHRDLAEMFAGTAPAPGGMFGHAVFDQLRWGPRLSTATTWAGVRVESDATVGWSRLVTTVVEELEVGADDEPLRHRRGRYAREGRGHV